MFINLIRHPSNTFVVEEGKIYNEEYTEGYILRSESLVNVDSSNNGYVAIKAEGDKVANGEKIYRYCVDDESEINSEIEAIDEEIQEKLTNDETYYSIDFKSINSQIESKLNDCYDVGSDLKKLQSDKETINTYLTDKIKMKAEASNDTELKNLINQRNEYEKRLDENSKYITAEESGVISYKVDGYESVLKSDDFSYLSEEFLDNLKIDSGNIIASSDTKGKIVNNYKCNLVVILDSDDAKNSEINDKIKIRLQNSDEISAKIVYKSEQSDGKVLIVFEINKDVVDLIQYRKISFDVIWSSYSGIKISNSAIKYEDIQTNNVASNGSTDQNQVENSDENSSEDIELSDGKIAYVIRNRVGLEEKIYIKILKSNDKYSIVDNYTYAELKSVGVDISANSKKTLTVYDEIEQ